MSQVYFTDRDLGRSVPNALAAGWIPFSHNKDIRYRTQERDMVMRAGVPLFILIGNAPHRELATNLVQTMPRIIEFLGSHQVPFIAKVYRPSPVEAVQAGRSGKVSLWLDQSGWEKALKHGG